MSDAGPLGSKVYVVLQRFRVYRVYDPLPPRQALRAAEAKAADAEAAEATAEADVAEAEARLLRLGSLFGFL